MQVSLGNSTQPVVTWESLHTWWLLSHIALSRNYSIHQGHMECMHPLKAYCAGRCFTAYGRLGEEHTLKQLSKFVLNRIMVKFLGMVLINDGRLPSLQIFSL